MAVDTKVFEQISKIQGFNHKEKIMKRILMVAVLVMGGLILGGMMTSTADAGYWGPGGRYYGRPYYGYRAGWVRPYGYRYGYRPYAPGVIVTTPGFGVATPGFGIGVGPVYGYPAPYPAYGYGYYGW
jgi:hypothetical protein